MVLGESITIDSKILSDTNSDFDSLVSGSSRRPISERNGRDENSWRVGHWSASEALDILDCFSAFRFTMSVRFDPVLR